MIDDFMVLFEETAFESLIGGSFTPVRNITAFAPVCSVGFIKLLPSVKMEVVLSFKSFSS